MKNNLHNSIRVRESTMTILLVDDNQVNLFVIEKILKMQVMKTVFLFHLLMSYLIIYN